MQGWDGVENPEGLGFCPAHPPLKAAGEGVWEGQEAPVPGDGLGLTLTPGRGMAGPPRDS